MTAFKGPTLYPRRAAERWRAAVPLAAPASPRGKTGPPARVLPMPASVGVCRTPVSRLFTSGGVPIAVRVSSPPPHRPPPDLFRCVPRVTRLRGRGERNGRPPPETTFVRLVAPSPPPCSLLDAAGSADSIDCPSRRGRTPPRAIRSTPCPRRQALSGASRDASDSRMRARACRSCCSGCPRRP